mgnify:FL=1|jgi:16S rRNA (cytidine1402-2'-O)-methyltransferase
MPLTVVPTPVGNLEDITLRAIRVLREADIILCEDTRTTSILTRRYAIRTPLVSYHAHNERSRTDEFVGRLLDGERVALVSDAGTPGISDPGAYIIAAALQADIDVDVLPGATAFVPALLLSGLPVHPFLFFGFLPDKAGERKAALEVLRSLPQTMIFYVSPHKLADHIESVAAVFGNRNAALVREISKIHQESIRGTLDLIMERVRRNDVLRGEMVLVVGGAPVSETADSEWRGAVGRLLAEQIDARDIVKTINQLYGVPKNRVKEYLFSEKTPGKARRD